MRNIKLIVLDLDGTLLKSDKTVSVVTLDALEQARRAGIKATPHKACAQIAPSDFSSDCTRSTPAG